jgi:hypothetical protein
MLDPSDDNVPLDYYPRTYLVIKILLIASAFMLLACYPLKFLFRTRTNSWPRVVGVIKSATMEVVGKEGGKWYNLPCFKFSYTATGKNYSGRFMLFTSAEKGESLVCQLIGHSIELRHDPKHPSTWYIPSSRIEHCGVVQEIGPNVRDLHLPND